MLAKSHAGQIWCWSNLVLAKSDAGQILHWSNLMLVKSETEGLTGLNVGPDVAARFAALVKSGAGQI